MAGYSQHLPRRLRLLSPAIPSLGVESWNKKLGVHPAIDKLPSENIHRVSQIVKLDIIAGIPHDLAQGLGSGLRLNCGIGNLSTGPGILTCASG